MNTLDQYNEAINELHEKRNEFFLRHYADGTEINHQGKQGDYIEILNRRVYDFETPKNNDFGSIREFYFSYKEYEKSGFIELDKVVDFYITKGLESYELTIKGLECVIFTNGKKLHGFLGRLKVYKKEKVLIQFLGNRFVELRQPSNLLLGRKPTIGIEKTNRVKF